METPELTEAFLAKTAGWEAMKRARILVGSDRVLSSSWKPPILLGVVQEGDASYRAGLVIKGAFDIENLCPCRASSQWGAICAHAVAVGLHFLRSAQPVAEAEPQGATGGRPAGDAKRAARPVGSAFRLRRAEGAEAGEPAELHLVLPPNFAVVAAAKSRIMLCCEAVWRGKRSPLNALPRDVPFRWSAADARMLDGLEVLAGGETPAPLMISTDDFVGLLAVLVEHPRIWLGRSQRLEIGSEVWRPKVRASLLSSGEIELRGEFSAGQTPVVLAGEPAWVCCGTIVQPLALPRAYLEILKGVLRIPRTSVPGMLGPDWPKLQASCELQTDFQPEDFVLEPCMPRFKLSLHGGLAQLQAVLQCGYGVRIVTPGVTAPEDAFWIPDPASAFHYSARNLPAEQAALSRLWRSGFRGPDAHGRLELKGQDSVFNFFAREYPRLIQEWEVTMEERLERSTAQNLERVTPEFQVTPSGEQWFDLAVTFKTASGEALSAAEVQRLLLSGQGFRRLKNGRVAVLDTGAVEELQEVLRDCEPQQHGAGYRIPQTQAAFLDATVREQPGWQWQAPSAWRDRLTRLTGESTRALPTLGALESVLRPYQKQGVGWLCFLRRNGWGGLLADEMGLGKTLQILAYLQALRSLPETGSAQALTSRADEETRPPHEPAIGGRSSCDASGKLWPEAGLAGARPSIASRFMGPTHTIPDGKAAPHGPHHVDEPGRQPQRFPSLVVCPTSLVFNWQAEAHRFTPDLKVLVVHGPRREALFDQIAAHDLVITSYALMRRDAERYRAFEFDTVVLDEAQHIKNRQTQNAQAVKSVRARHRLVLTGTPMENSVLDLWSIFDFLMPGYLGSARDFRERYEGPIVRDRDPKIQTRLARRIRPFVLRRSKREVAPELPAKIEQVACCELTEAQAAVYQEILHASRREILAAVGAQGLGKSRMVILTALLRLRQVCCDLRLLKLENIDPATASAKLDLFGELLDEALDGNHRVLVFSQFVELLSLVKEQLRQNSLPFCYLDGSTRDRMGEVARFQKTPEIPVFLISLKAGGLGLNLTAADTVIHFDPWWNPAVEDQATDRAHRIGQQRIVTSYKLITRGTVEEKILNLQQRKRELVRETLTGEDALSEVLSWEEIQELLA